MFETSNSTKNIQEAILRLQEALPVIRKNSDNPYFKSKYAEYPEIQAAIRAQLVKETITTMFFPVTENKLILLATHTKSNEFYKIAMDLKTIQDSPQAQGSAITYGKRYMITALFDLQIEDALDDDGNAGSGNNKKSAAGDNAAPQTQPPANLPWLNQNTKDWFNAKWNIFNNKKSIDHVKKTFKVNAKNADVLLKSEDLKPGTAYWNLAVEYLSKDGSKAEKITSMFIISDSDLQDLQIDATNYTPAETPQPEVK